VRSGAGVSFVLPFTPGDGAKFWRAQVSDVARGARLTLVARTGPELDQIVGTVSLLPVATPNQPHRADISKLLVHSEHRGLGVARALMTAVAEVAWEHGRTLLTLDCVTGGAAERLYLNLGFQVVGVIPGYALSPSGEPEGATFLYRDLNVG
jgi:GNAT superfamily N-acetyltransferase